MQMPHGFLVLFVGSVLSLAGCAPKIDFGTANASSPGAVTGMDHILLTVSDMGRSIEFYRDVLGMRAEYRSLHFAMLRAGNCGVALSSRPWPFEKKGEPKGIGMIPHFTTANMEDFAARLQKNGISWLRAPVRESFGIEAFLTDPDGYQWAVLAPLNP
jgi:catechol 2,3-dioxygenase-like lactoylglutathione lyase family enzyme